MKKCFSSCFPSFPSCSIDFPSMPFRSPILSFQNRQKPGENARNGPKPFSKPYFVTCFMILHVFAAVFLHVLNVLLIFLQFPVSFLCLSQIEKNLQIKGTSPKHFQNTMFFFCDEKRCVVNNLFQQLSFMFL